MKRWLLALVLAGLALPGRGDTGDREWAEAMLVLRRQAHADAGSSLLMAQVRPAVERMLAEYPYRTDWFLQDQDNNLEAWLNQVDEPAVERELMRQFADAANRVSPQPSTEDPGWLETYAGAAARRRESRLVSLRDTAPRILFTKNHTIEPSFFAYTEGQSDAQAERHFRPGTALCEMSWEGFYAVVTESIVDPHGRIRDPEVSFDGARVLFAWKKSDRLDDYHLYEWVPKSGAVRQLTAGQGVADFEPCYLPDGSILFSSSRCVQTVDCWWTEVSNLYTCGPDGESLRRLGFDQVHTTTPALLPDGRVIYTRWDYNDRGQVFPQGLFQMNPDGTGQTEFYGNNSWFPTTLSHARGIPGSSRVIAVAHGHHTWQAGELVLVDVARGRQEADGIRLIAPVRETKAVRVDAYGQDGDLFQYPYPLNEQEYLVAYSPLGGRPTRFAIYYMDIHGNRELLVSDPAISCQHPMPLAPRTRPGTRPSAVDYARDTGAYYLQDVYHGPGLAGVPRGTIRKLRVVGLDFRAAGVGRNGSSGPAGGALASTPISTGNGAWDVKRVLGETPVYPDGSAFFEAPAHTPLYFQALDREGQAVQTMRSWSTLMPGETASCVGCHENKNITPPPRRTSLAARAGAQPLEPFYGPPRGFSFSREIQPILDRSCIPCHDGAKAPPDLTATPVVDKAAKRVWTQSYLALTASQRKDEDAPVYGDPDGPWCRWISAQSVPTMIPPRQSGSPASPLLALLRAGHEGVTLNPEAFEKLACWIDLGVPYCGDYTEAGAWTPEEQAFYARYQAKRDYFAGLDQRSIEALAAGRQPAPPRLENPYRNLVPEATTTSDGDDSRTQTRLAWETPVYVDRIRLAGRPSGGGRIEFSDGRTLRLPNAEPNGMCTIEIPVRSWPPSLIQWVRLPPSVTADTVEAFGRNHRGDLPF